MTKYNIRNEKLNNLCNKVMKNEWLYFRSSGFQIQNTATTKQINN